MSDLAFEQMLAAHNEEFREAAEFGQDWMPPVDAATKSAEYISTVVKIQSGVLKGDGGHGWWKLTGRIEEPSNPDLNGKEYPIGFFASDPKKVGFLKAAAKTLNNGNSVKSKIEANEIFKTSLGKILRCKIVETSNEKGIFTNCYIQEVYAEQTDIATQETPPMQEPQEKTV